MPSASLAPPLWVVEQEADVGLLAHLPLSRLHTGPSMSINPKTIKVSDIQASAEVVLAHLNAHTTSVAQGMTAEETAVAMMETALRSINHQMTGNAGAAIISARALVARNKRVPATVADLSPQALDLATLALGTTPATGTNTTPAVADTTDPDTIALDNLLEIIIGAKVSITTILAVRDHLQADKAKAQAALSADPDKGLSFTPSEPSGLANLPKTHALVAAVDPLLQRIEDGTTWAALVDTIATLESELEDIARQDRDRRAQHTAQRVTEPAAMAPQATVINAPANDAELTALDTSVSTVMRKGHDIFPKAYGASLRLLDFAIPTLQFSTPHPDVPAVDPSYKFYVPVLVEAMQAMTDNEILWLYGDSGCGKSEFWKQVAAHLGMPFTRLNMDGHLTRGDIIGVNRMVPNAERQMEMRFVDGILPRAMARPGLLLIDELDLGDPEIMAVLQPVFEGEPLRILEDHGRVVRPHPLFRVAVTGNTTGLGSETNAYLNAFEQSAATRDRIAAFVKMPYMTPSIEKGVLMERMPGIDEAFLDRLIMLANKVRDGYANRTIHQIFSTRSTLAAARRYMRFADLYADKDQAAREILETVILNRMDAESRLATKDLIDNIFV